MQYGSLGLRSSKWGIAPLALMASSSCTPAAFDDSRAKFIGNYALRAQYLATADGNLRYTEMAYATIEEGEEGELRMRVTACSWSNEYEGIHPLVPNFPVNWGDVPGKVIPERRLALRLDGCRGDGECHWRAQAEAPFAVGYKPSLPPICEGHANEEVEDERDDRPWQADAGSCRCPERADSPPDEHDCRLEPNPSLPMRPGIRTLDRDLAYQGQVSYVGGQRAPDGTLTAREQRTQTFTFLDCASASSCPKVERLCASDKTAVTLVRLRDGQVSAENPCAAIDAQGDQLVPPVALDFPAGGCQ